MSSKSFLNEVTCSLCVKYFIDPVTLGCGHSFCMPCLCLYWEEGQWPPRCPVCRETNHQLNLKTNTDLRKLVLLARQKGLYDLPNPAEEICEIHRYTKNFFCKVTKDVRCLLCCMSEQQGAPKHGSIQWTAEEYRSYVSTWKKMKQTEYRKVFHLVDHEEKHHLEKTEEESKEIFQQLKESQYNMDLKQKLLRQIYEELKDLCHKPDMELIQHYENMSKSKSNGGGVTFSLNNEVSSQHIRLFDDLRNLKYEHDSLLASSDGGTAKYFAAWGAQSFTSSTQYWEMLVDSSWDWAVGICKDSWIRKDNGILDESNRDNFLLVCVKQDEHYQLWTTTPATPLYRERPLGRAGVFLDCDRGSVSFVDVAKHSLLWSTMMACALSLSGPSSARATGEDLSHGPDGILRTPSLAGPLSSAAKEYFIVFRLILL
ncbi:tripartite motif-containing protein 43-like [Ovis aries]|uniref:tripartite motif-containing protein 43-like n=1 Tax=Ovis aries TaxID=9940 RepID=UPI00100FF16B|nr:tripartite motif-containing protein 43-like [Ovis aries]